PPPVSARCSTRPSRSRKRMAISTPGLRSPAKTKRAPTSARTRASAGTSARQDRRKKAEAVGVIGLGIMGSAMAANLVREGFHVVGFDVVPEAGRRLRRAGGEAARDIRAVADAAPVIITSLPSASALVQVATELAAGPKGPRRSGRGADLSGPRERQI